MERAQFVTCNAVSCYEQPAVAQHAGELTQQTVLRGVARHMVKHVEGCRTREPPNRKVERGSVAAHHFNICAREPTDETTREFWIDFHGGKTIRPGTQNVGRESRALVRPR